MRVDARCRFVRGSAPARLRWDGDTLVIDSTRSPRRCPARLRGTVRADAGDARSPTSSRSIPAGKHRWQPVAPRARIEVAMDAARRPLDGTGYFDSAISASEPLEAGFDDWHWSRAHLARRYGRALRRRPPRRLELSRSRCGSATTASPSTVAAPPRHRLPRTGWRMARDTRADAGATPRVRRPGSTRPFYARSALRHGCSARTVPRRAREPVARALPVTDRPVDAPLTGCRGAVLVTSGGSGPLVARNLAVDRDELPDAEQRTAITPTIAMSQQAEPAAAHRWSFAKFGSVPPRRRVLLMREMAERRACVVAAPGICSATSRATDGGIGGIAVGVNEQQRRR